MRLRDFIAQKWRYGGVASGYSQANEAPESFSGGSDFYGDEEGVQ